MLVFTHDYYCIVIGSLKMECEKLASEKSEMQRHYVMVSELIVGYKGKRRKFHTKIKSFYTHYPNGCHEFGRAHLRNLAPGRTAACKQANVAALASRWQHCTDLIDPGANRTQVSQSSGGVDATTHLAGLAQ